MSIIHTRDCHKPMSVMHFRYKDGTDSAGRRWYGSRIREHKRKHYIPIAGITKIQGMPPEYKVHTNINAGCPTDAIRRFNTVVRHHVIYQRDWQNQILHFYSQVNSQGFNGRRSSHPDSWQVWHLRADGLYRRIEITGAARMWWRS